MRGAGWGVLVAALGSVGWGCGGDAFSSGGEAAGANAGAAGARAGAAGAGGASAGHGGANQGGKAQGGQSGAGAGQSGQGGAAGASGGGKAQGGAGQAGAAGTGGSAGGGGAAGGGCGQGTKPCGGVCVGLEDPAYGCAAAGCEPCSVAHGAATCEAGACAVAQCQAGFDDCDKQAATGCEAELISDKNNCGGCGKACDGGLVCSKSQCLQDCGGLVNCDGSCADIQSSTQHCGGCDRPCAPAGAVAACVGGACQIAACQDTLADCDHSVDNGCEANTQSSSEHCGACGHSCLGGLCVQGTCQPVLVATDQGDVREMASNGVEVFWIAPGTTGMIRRLDAQTGQISDVTIPQLSPGGVAADTNYVYWTLLDGSIRKSAASGPLDKLPGTIATAQTGAGGLTAGPEGVFWSRTDGKEVVGLTSVGVSVIASGQNRPDGVVTRGDWVFWTNQGTPTADADFTDGQVMQVQILEGKPAAEPAPLATNQHFPTSIDADDTHVAWTTFKAGEISLLDRVSGKFSVLATEQKSPLRVRMDATHVYWTNYDGHQVMRAARSPSLVKASVVTETSAQPTALAVDAKAVYFGTTTGEIWRVVK